MILFHLYFTNFLIPEKNPYTNILKLPIILKKSKLKISQIIWQIFFFRCFNFCSASIKKGKKWQFLSPILIFSCKFSERIFFLIAQRVRLVRSNLHNGPSSVFDGDREGEHDSDRSSIGTVGEHTHRYPVILRGRGEQALHMVTSCLDR